MLKNYFPGSATDLDLARASSLAAIPNGQAKDDGVAVGNAAAAAMVANRASDGASAAAQFYMPPSANPGEWQTTPACPPAGGILLHWRDVTPFGIRSSDQFRSAPPPPLTSSKYTKDYNEVKDVGALTSTARPQDRTDVARYFATAVPVQIWSQAMIQASTAQGKSLPENARAFALLMMAISDAFISTFDTKYHYVFWRPITAIQQLLPADDDGNPLTEADPTWTPLTATPPYPDYTSGANNLSGSFMTLVARFFNTDKVTFKVTTTAALASPSERTYHRFSDLADDVIEARLYMGIHFRFADTAARKEGTHIARHAFNHFLRPMHDNGHDHDGDCVAHDDNDD
jgi:hypothetical protein